VFAFETPLPKDPTRPITSFKTAWIKVRQKAAVKGRWHDNRHTLVTELAESGAGDEVIMSIAGHVSRAMLSRYSHVRMEAKRRALDEIAARQRAADEKRQKEAERQRRAASVSLFPPPISLTSRAIYGRGILAPAFPPGCALLGGVAGCPPPGALAPAGGAVWPCRDVAPAAGSAGFAAAGAALGSVTGIFSTLSPPATECSETFDTLAKTSLNTKMYRTLWPYGTSRSTRCSPSIFRKKAKARWWRSPRSSITNASFHATELCS